MSKLRSWNIL